MPGKHTPAEKRQAEHVADSERARGVPPDKAKSIGWATVNKEKGKGGASSGGKKK